MGINQEDAKSFEDMASEMDAAPATDAKTTEAVAETTEEVTEEVTDKSDETPAE